MVLLTEEQIKDFVDSHNYDLRVSRNGRWIDQKCAADVVSIVADCILNYTDSHNGEYFSTKSIWYCDYTVENVEAVFSKPNPKSDKAKNEYDKFFQQPMEMLAYAGVLDKKKVGSRNTYKVKNVNILSYIALRERNALIFLNLYIAKVLKDSGIYFLFERFFLKQTEENYLDMKNGYAEFIIENTKISGIVECNRIFIKVLNPLAYFRRARGTEKGRMSSNPITYDMLMYNRNNFRDLYSNKPKGITRKEYAMSGACKLKANLAYYKYQSTKAKRFLRIFNDKVRNSVTELLDGSNDNDKATHMHHIFPESTYPEICYYLENLIALTPTQHLNYAHPDGKTREIDEQYQHLLLLAKTKSIEENLNDDCKDNIIYDFNNFIKVLNVGFDDDNVLNIDDMDFCSVVNAINLHYSIDN